MKNVWKLENALELVRKLQPIALTNGYAISLGGSVLNAGFSWKDLDLVAMPGCQEDQDEKTFLKAFADEGYIPLNILDTYPGIKVYKLSDGKLNIDLILPILESITPKEAAEVAKKVKNRLVPKTPKVYREEDNFS